MNRDSGMEMRRRDLEERRGGETRNKDRGRET
jgi:hypothetical protein